MKNKAIWIILGVVVGLMMLVFLMFGGTYNQLVKTEEQVKAAWAQVENVYQRRLDLIPNLVATVKGYAAHEQKTLQGVVEARAQATQMNVTADVVNDPAALQKFQAIQGQLSSALSRLLAVAENYPDLKASQNFLALQTQLEGTENRITVERNRFNEISRKFNTLCRMFPSNFIASIFNFKQKAYFKADEAAAKPPKVEF